MAGEPDTAAEHRENVRRRLKEAMVARDAQDVELLRTAIEVACALDPSMEDIAPARQLLDRIESEMQPLTFTDVPFDAAEELQASRTREEAQKVLMRCMCISLDQGFQAEILCEFHYHNFTFCQLRKFSTAALSTFLSIMQVVHTKAIVQERWRKPQAEKLFEELIRKHSTALPPYRFGALTDAEALAAREFANRGFFRHYDMYAFAYSGRQELKLSTLHDPVVPKVPPAAALHRAFEVDPRTVPELQELFAEPEDGATSAGLLTPAAGGIGRDTSLGSLHALQRGDQTGGGAGRQAEIEAVIDEALHTGLGGLAARLEKHALAS